MASVSTIFQLPPQKHPRLSHKKLLRALSKKHSRLRDLIKRVGPLNYSIPLWPSINDAVLYAVIGQMLSISATKMIIQSLLSRFKSSENVMQWAGKSLRRKGPVMGVSWRKRKALSEWNKYFIQNRRLIRRWKTIPLEDYKKQATSVWGLGNWSAEMIAIFHLGRMDIWPTEDVGLKRACRDAFGIADCQKIKGLVAGYETLASIYLWESLNKRD